MNEKLVALPPQSITAKRTTTDLVQRLGKYFTGD
jgi:hypothetical protein